MGDWEKLGPMVWTRFRAVGVPDPRQATADWLRSHGSASRTVLLADTIRWALTAGAQAPDPRALAALGISLAQLKVLQGGDPELFLVLADRFDIGDAARAIDSTIASIETKLKKIDEDWQAVTEPLPEGSQPDGHPDTLRIAALLQGELGPMQAGQVEDHIEKCAFCTERYLAWIACKEQFDQLTEPPPPPKKSYTAAAIMLLAAGTASALAVLAVVAVAWFDQVRSLDEATWHGQPATVELVSDRRPVEDPEAGQTVSIRFEPRFAPYYAVVRARGEQLEVLHTGAVRERGGHELAPVDLLVDPADRGVWVVLGDHPLTPEEVGAAVQGDAAPGVVPTWHAL